MHDDFVETIAANVKQDVPILGCINKELSELVKNDSGDTVSVALPDYGIVTKGKSFYANGNVTTLGTITALQVKQGKVDVTLENQKIGATYDVLEKTLKIYDKKRQIEDTRISNLARTINAEIFKTVLSAAHSSIVGPIGFTELSEAIAYVDESCVGDKTSGMLSPLLNNTIAASGNQKFAHTTLGKDLYKGIIGNWQDCEFFKSADAGSMKLGNKAAQEFAFSGNVANVEDGATVLNLSGITFGGADFVTIPKGTPIIIGSGDAKVPGSIDSPFTMSSVYGEDTRITRTFVVTEDAKITAGNARVKIAQVWLNSKIEDEFTRAEAAVPNTFYTADATQDNLKFICPLLYGAKYALGAVFASKSVAFASAQPREFTNCVSKSTSLDGELNVRSSVWTDGADAQEGWRVDVLWGCAPLYGTGAVALYAQIA
jgi:hypothetical protein